MANKFAFRSLALAFKKPSGTRETANKFAFRSLALALQKKRFKTMKKRLHISIVRTAGIALAAVTALTSPASARAQTVDAHSHIITTDLIGLLARHGAELEETFPLPAWSAEAHVAFMDSAGIN